MSNIKPILVAILLTGLFAIALFSFGIRLADLNNANQSIADDPAVSSYAGSLNESLIKASSDTRGSQEAIESSPTTLSTGVFIIDAIGAVWKTIISVPTTIYNLTVGLLLSKIFGDNTFAIAFSVVGSILAILIILGVWRLLSTGESD